MGNMSLASITLVTIKHEFLFKMHMKGNVKYDKIFSSQTLYWAFPTFIN